MLNLPIIGRELRAEHTLMMGKKASKKIVDFIVDDSTRIDFVDLGVPGPRLHTLHAHALI